MNIRLLDTDEKHDALNLVKEVFFQENNLGYTPEGARSFLKLLDEAGLKMMWLGAYEKALEGVIGWDPDTMHILWLFVREENRRKRIGTFLVQELSKIAFTEGYDRLTLSGRCEVREFYDFLGFLPEGEEYIRDGVRLQRMELMLADRFLGTQATVCIEHTIGELHGVFADEQYLCNTGYIEELAVHSGLFQDAYVIGQTEPAESFMGTVIGIVYRREGGSAWIVADGTDYDHAWIIDQIAFQEQYYETRIVWYEQRA